MTDGLRRIAMVSMHTSPADQPGSGDAGGMNVVILALAAHAGTPRCRGRPSGPRDGGAGDARTRRWRVTLRALAAGPLAPIPKNRLVDVADEFGEAVATLVGRHRTPLRPLHAHYWLSGLATLPVAIELGRPFVQSFHTLAAMKNRSLAPGDVPEHEGRLRGEAFLGSQADAIVAGRPRR